MSVGSVVMSLFLPNVHHLCLFSGSLSVSVEVTSFITSEERLRHHLADFRGWASLLFQALLGVGVGGAVATVFSVVFESHCLKFSVFLAPLPDLWLGEQPLSGVYGLHSWCLQASGFFWDL